jgi:hypothetical protein
MINAVKKPARGEEAQMKKTSIAVREDLWRRFRASNLLEGRESGDVLSEIIEAYLKKKERKNHGTR